MKRNLSSIAPMLTLTVLIVVASILSPNFLSFSNLKNVVQFSAETGVLAIGMTLIIIAGGGGIDLSVGSVLALAGVLAAGNQDLGPWGALVLAAGAGLLLGTVNGIVVTRGRVEPFMATLAMLAIARALTLWYTNGGPIIGKVSKSYEKFADTELLDIPLPAYYLLVAVVAGFIVLNHTRFGRHVYAVGGDEETARLAGINVDRVRLILYMVSGLLAGLAGALVTSRIAIGEPRAGAGYELAAIAAVIVGGTSLAGGRGSIQGTLVGTLILAVLANLVSLLDISSYVQPVIRGVVILGAAYLLLQGGRKKLATA